MLGAMFRESMPTAKDDQGRYFIDRDGPLFGIILSFLRSRQLVLPEKFGQFDILAVEADYYQIQPLIDAIQEARSKMRRGYIIEVIEKTECHTLTNGDKMHANVTTTISAHIDVAERLNFVHGMWKECYWPAYRYVTIHHSSGETVFDLAVLRSKPVWPVLGDFLHNNDAKMIERSDISHTEDCLLVPYKEHKSKSIITKQRWLIPCLKWPSKTK